MSLLWYSVLAAARHGSKTNLATTFALRTERCGVGAKLQPVSHPRRAQNTSTLEDKGWRLFLIHCFFIPRAHTCTHHLEPERIRYSFLFSLVPECTWARCVSRVGTFTKKYIYGRTDLRTRGASGRTGREEHKELTVGDEDTCCRRRQRRPAPAQGPPNKESSRARYLFSPLDMKL